MIESNEPSIELRQRLQKVLTETESFMGTSAFAYYREARMREVEGLRSDIISIDPIDRAGEIESYKLRGDLRTTEEFLTLFEDLVASLKDRIGQMLDSEQPKQHQ